MTHDVTLKERILFGYLAPLLLIVGLAVAMYWTTQGVQRISESVEVAHGIVDEIKDLHLELNRMQSVARGIIMKAVVVHEVLDVALGRRLLSALSEVQNGIHPILAGAVDAGGRVCMLLDPEALMAQAGASLTPRDAPAADLFPEATEAQRAVWRERARMLAEPEVQVTADAGRAVVVASLGGELFAVALGDVQELTRFRDPAPIPCCPPHVVGHIPLRGDIVTLIDLRGFLGLPVDPPWTHGDLIVCEVQGLPLGVPVEQVVDVLRVQDQALAPVPSILGGGMETHLLGILKHAGRPVTLIDLKGLLEGPELLVNDVV